MIIIFNKFVIFNSFRYKTLFFFLLISFSLTLGEDYYELLRLERTADQREIRKAFKKLAVTQHPDKNTVIKKKYSIFPRWPLSHKMRGNF